MSDVCCVKNCPSLRQDNSTVSLHSFPSDDEVKKLWITALSDTTWEPSPTDLVCSLHFQKTDFVLDENGDPTSPAELSSEAVPSILLEKCPEVTIDEEMSEAVDDMKSTDVTSSKSQKDVAENREKPLEIKYAHLLTSIKVDINASREELLKNYVSSYTDRQILMRKNKTIKQKNLRTIEKIAKACDRSEESDIPEVKKKKKMELSKIVPRNLEEVFAYLEAQDLLSIQAINNMRAILCQYLNEPIPDNAKEKDLEITPVMKTFAKTLLFYSAEAYHMVKELYELPIPSPSVSRTWYNMGLGLPGWSSEAFLFLKEEIQKCDSSVLHTCVIISETDINSFSSFDDGEVRGHIDFGTTGDLAEQNYTENLPLAQSALFFMLVPMSSNMKWKIPLAYFLIDSLSPDERANIIMECLWRVFNMGSVAVALVVDASVNSRQTIECLGVSFEDLPYPSTSFPHPADGLLDVLVVFDPSHILDLMRHTWASIGLMVDERGGAISWKYFTELVKVQETQGGCTEQTDQIATWYWNKNLMRQKLIAQLFTNDVANAIQCCSDSLALPQFSGCEPTVAFIRTVIKTIDILNPTTSSLKNDEWKKSIVDALNYIFVLRDRTGQGIFATNCKIPFVLLYMNLISVLEISKKVSSNYLKNLNLSSLELLFLAIRSRCDWEECPTASKFCNAYSLLLQEEGIAFQENVLKVDGFWWLDVQDVASARRSGLVIHKPVIKLENTPPLPHLTTFYPVLLQSELQRFRASQLILVHTVKRVTDILHCNSCIDGLQMSYMQDNPTLVLLRRTCGGFVYPSQGVVEVCSLANRHLNTELKVASVDVKSDAFARRESVLVQRVCIAVLNSVLDRQKNLFPYLDNHLKECPQGSNHICRLIRVLTASYVFLKLQSLRALSLVPAS